MNDDELIYQLLHLALVDIREQGYQQKNAAVYHLADLFHNIVGEMGRAARGECSYESIKELLELQASRKGCSDWLRDRIDELEGREAGGG